MVRVIFILSIVLYFGCSTPNANTHSGMIRFQKPHVTGILPPIKPEMNIWIRDSFLLKDVDSLFEKRPIYAGKFTFSDTINITSADSFYTKDEIDFFGLQKAIDTLSTTGFELVPDYHSVKKDSNGNVAYPVFLVNETSSAKVLPLFGGHISAIQEALDSNGQWRPIEYDPSMRYWTCSNSDGGMIVHPNEFITFYMPIYEGTFKTSLRVRMQLAGCTYVSPPFKGNIKYSQFYIKKNTWLSKYLSHHYMRVIPLCFYGSVPLGFDYLFQSIEK